LLGDFALLFGSQGAFLHKRPKITSQGFSGGICLTEPRRGNIPPPEKAQQTPLAGLHWGAPSERILAFLLSIDLHQEVVLNDNAIR
jgi:hypothetical protein